MFSKFRDKFIGSKKFYAMVLALVLPMILQATVTNFVSLLDNIMVGRVGTEQMSGVSIANQFVFIFNITVFGAVSGPSIFGAQFFGKGDYEGQRSTFRFRLIVGTLLIAIFMLLAWCFDEELISLFISDEDDPVKIAETLKYGKIYMRIVLIGFIPFGYGQVYASVVRESGETRIPMIGSICAVFINLILDYGLIFGRLRMPELGVAGAAWATVISKLVEALVVIIWVHAKPEKNKHSIGLYRSLKIPGKLTTDMIKKGFPLLANEFLWSLGMSAVAQSYSVRGIDVVAARNIAGTMTNLFNVVFIQTGACIGIIIGQKLGAGLKEEARTTDNKLLFFSIAASTVTGIIMLPVAKYFPLLYNTDDEIRSLATFFILISALAMPMWAFTNASYFTIRSGGKTGITFLFDFVYTWVIMIPLAFVIAYFTDMAIRPMFVLVTFSELIKVVIGIFMVKSDMWINTLVDEK